MACNGAGHSPYRKKAIRNTSAGEDARIGVAIEIGSVRSAQNVSTHEAPTTAHLTADSATTSGVRPDTAAANRPQSASEAMYAAHPQHVEMKRTGSTALLATLAFFVKS